MKGGRKIHSSGGNKIRKKIRLFCFLVSIILTIPRFFSLLYDDDDDDTQVFHAYMVCLSLSRLETNVHANIFKKDSKLHLERIINSNGSARMIWWKKHFKTL